VPAVVEHARHTTVIIHFITIIIRNDDGVTRRDHGQLRFNDIIFSQKNLLFVYTFGLDLTTRLKYAT